MGGRQEARARPSLDTAQREQSGKMRREDLPEEMGMLRSEWALVNEWTDIVLYMRMNVS
jgi:hypothetical protein